MLISPARLAAEGWLGRDSLEPLPRFDPDRVEFGRVGTWKARLLRRSWSRFLQDATPQARRELDSFVEAPEQRYWLEDWALYAALKQRSRGRSWTRWDPELRAREANALASVARELADEVAYQRYLQFLFFRQWAELRGEAGVRGLTLLGDVPFYVAPDSADVWAHRGLFRIDPRGRPTHMAGVPPDYFSDTGQLWGNPVYRWDRMAEQGYAWWLERIRANLRLVDGLRLDHFRGFVAYWEIEAGAESAAGGRWVRGPGRALFDALEGELGELPLVAEDLGVITPEVERLRDDLGLPGMHVLQFAFSEPDSTHLPEHHAARSVVYTGTHDNNTLLGWINGLRDEERKRVLDYAGTDPEAVVQKLVEVAYRSPARLALAPLQDFLGLDGTARMNRPGTTAGNWRWRVRAQALSLRLAARLRELAARHDR
jgi:4-alpha-glucanotransferase